MNILAVDFSSSRRSVAVLTGHPASEPEIVVPRLLGEANDQAHRSGHLPLIDAALHAAHMPREAIDCIAVGIGPGSYTGIRASISFAQGWQLARASKLLGISSAEALAQDARDRGFSGRLTVAIDAHRSEFYLAVYSLDSVAIRLLEPLRLVPMSDLRARLSVGETVIGPTPEQPLAGIQPFYPEGRSIGRLAMGRTDYIPGEKLEPIYLRQTTFVKAPPPGSLS